MTTLFSALKFVLIIILSTVKGDYEHHQEFVIINEGDGDVNFIGSSNLNSNGRTEEECLQKGSFHFPGEHTYENANKVCGRRDGKLLIFSFVLDCASGKFYSTYQDALCLKNCRNTDDVNLIIHDQITAKYPSCSPRNIEFTREILSTAECLDKTREIGSNMEVLKTKLNLTHTIENGSIHFSHNDTVAFSEECTNKTGQIVSSSFVERVLTNDTNAPGRCKFTEMLNEESDKVRVYNWPRCFASICSPKLIKKLLPSPENLSKWHCGRDVFSVDFKAIAENRVYNETNDPSANENDVNTEPGSTPNASSGRQSFFTNWILLLCSLGIYLFPSVFG